MTGADGVLILKQCFQVFIGQSLIVECCIVEILDVIVNCFIFLKVVLFEFLVFYVFFVFGRVFEFLEGLVEVPSNVSSFNASSRDEVSSSWDGS